MITSETIKEIIIENERFISTLTENLIPREGMRFPSAINKVCVFYGVRRSGKSFLLYDIFRHNKGNSLYLDFEDERLSGISIADLGKLKEVFLELNPHLIDKSGIVFLMDEIQNVSGWEKFARRMVEKEKLKLYCAGSSSKIMPKEIHTSLRGRMWCMGIFPFSFREFLRTKNIDPNKKDIMYGDSKILLKKYFQEYSRYGGFPEIVFLRSDFEKRKVVKEYMEAMFFRDLVEKNDITNIHLLDALKERIFSSFSTECSLTSFYKQYKDKFPFSKDSLFLYYRYFLESMLVFEVRKFSDSSYKRLRNPAKIYIIDIGLGKNVLSSATGRLLENIIFLELKRRGGEIFYFKEKLECDFIVKTEKGYSVYQVTMRLEGGDRAREIKGLVGAANYLGLKEGMIITYDEESVEKHEGINIKIIPAWKWLMAKD